MAKVLVTGGLGFLGSHLVERLLQKGDEVTIIDNCSTNTVSPEHVGKNCEVLVQDVEGATLPKGFDAVYHLASIVGPAGVLKHAGNIGYKMITTTKKLIDYCRAEDAMLVDISTSEVYGRDGFLSEDTPKNVPAKVSVRLEYGIGKLLGEIVIENSAKANDFRYQIVRPFNIAGTRQKPDGGFVLPRFVIAALKDEPITVFGTGKQIRAFTDVGDMAEAIARIKDSPLPNSVWNVGNPKNVTTIEELAHLVKRLSGSKSEIVYVDPKTIYGPLYEEAFDKLPDVSKLNRVLGWVPSRPLEPIVGDVVKYYRSHHY